LVGWIWLKETGELNPQLVELCKRAIDTASINVVGRAQAIIKNYSDLVPKVLARHSDGQRFGLNNNPRQMLREEEKTTLCNCNSFFFQLKRA